MFTEFYHISDAKVTGATNWPTYKLDGGDEFIYYFPDAYGWRIGELWNGTEQSEFSLESKIIILGLCPILWIGEILNTNNQNNIVIFWISQ